MSFKKIHQEILKKSSKFRIVKNEIEKNGIITLTEGQKVTFEVAVNKGKSSAVNIKLT